MNICAIVITYYPNLDELIENVEQYIEYVDHLIVWENTPLEDREAYHVELAECAQKISYMGVEKNMGIAFPLNRALDWAVENGYTHLLTMDQDSKWVNFDKYREALECCTDNNIAIFGPYIRNKYDFSQSINSSEMLITSGAVVPIKLCQKIGGFKESYFIDCIDTEYCYRVKVNGLKIGYIDSAVLEHSLGYTTKLKFISAYTANYSPFRLFYICRNNIWMWHEYKCSNCLPNHFFRHVIVKDNLVFRCFKILWAEKNKWSKISAIIKGTYIGFTTKDN